VIAEALAGMDSLSGPAGVAVLVAIWYEVKTHRKLTENGHVKGTP